jgi:acetoin utilization deacetylase AcuC-like enzyme
MGGYCFLNNAAVAAQALRDGGAARVAVLDVDYHHGNGTQAIFYDRADVLFVSIHGDPRTEYPFYLGHADETGAGEGAGCNLNLPLAAGSSAATWFGALGAGLRACSRLPVPMRWWCRSGWTPSRATRSAPSSCRRRISRAWGSGCRRLGLPTAFVLEGGYAAAELGTTPFACWKGSRS